MIFNVNQAVSNLFSGLARRPPAQPPMRRPRSTTGVAALGYLARGPIKRGLIPIEELALVVLNGDATLSGRWLAGYSGERVPWGVAWGGAERHEFLKDLTLPPKIGAPAAQLDLEDASLVELAYELSQLLEQQRSQRLPAVQRRLELPKLWAGFKRATANHVKGSGPELYAQCQRRSRSARALLNSSRRFHGGLVLFPLNWVSHRWRDIACVFADVGQFRKRQVFRLREPGQDLVGYRGASEFDFFHSQFRRNGRHT